MTNASLSFLVFYSSFFSLTEYYLLKIGKQLTKISEKASENYLVMSQKHNLDLFKNH